MKFIFLLMFGTRAEICNVTYQTIDAKPIDKMDFKLRKFKMKIGSNIYKFANGFGRYIADPYSYTLIDNTNTFGLLNVNKKIIGIICTAKECLKLNSNSIKHPNNLQITKYPLNKAFFKYQNNYDLKLDTSTKFLNEDHLTFHREFSVVPKQIVKIHVAIINEFDRYDKLKNQAFSDTLKIFSEAKKIIRKLDFDEISLDIVKTLILSRTNPRILNTKKPSLLEELEKKIKQNDTLNKKLLTSDLVILLTNDKKNDKEGISYLRGADDKETKYIIINLDSEDSIGYKAKVLVHEILHTLGSTHNKENCGFLMDEKFHDKFNINAKITTRSKKEIENFVVKKFLTNYNSIRN